MTLSKTKFQEERARKLRFDAETSSLNWRMETADLIINCSREIAPVADGRWKIAPGFKRTSKTLEIQIHSDAAVPAADGSIAPRHEGPATLVYSLHANGSIAVLLYPHSIDGSPVESSQRFVIDVLSHARDLAGASGCRRVYSHLGNLRLLSSATRAHCRPTRWTGRYLNKLSEKSERYSNIFESRQDVRRNWIHQNVTLGIGVIAGLIPGSIIPLARDYGVVVNKRISLEPYSPAPVKWLGDFLTTGGLLVTSLALAALMLIMCMRALKRR